MSLSYPLGALRPDLKKLANATRYFSATPSRRFLEDISALPPRTQPGCSKNGKSPFLSLNWPQPPRNVLIVPKLHTPEVTAASLRFSNYLHRSFPSVNLVFENGIAQGLYGKTPIHIYTGLDEPHMAKSRLSDKVDLVVTLGGDGTILRAACLFSNQVNVPPIVSFDMGKTGYMADWKFDEHEGAFEEVYFSGRKGGEELHSHPNAQILLRHRLKVDIYDRDGKSANQTLLPTATAEPLESPPHQSPRSPVHAMNELLIHRGINPHLASVDIYLDGHFFTEALADGVLVSTPTGSTAYSLSAGGPICHPLVNALLLTYICPRRPSLLPLVLPPTTKVVLRLSAKNRARDLEVSIDGKWRTAVKSDSEVHIENENIEVSDEDGSWKGGIPCIVRDVSNGQDSRGICDDWVRGLNRLLRFDLPFGASEGSSG